MLLSELAKGIGQVSGRDVEVLDVQHDSREVGPGELYCAIVGRVHDGHGFIRDAVAAGAVAVCVSRAGEVPNGVPAIAVDDTRDALGLLAARVHGEPTRELRIFGVTGTNGKTTTTYLLRHILRSAGRKVDLIGTVEQTIGGHAEKSHHTTPEATDLQRWFRRMRQMGNEDVVMEVSSHALDMGRVHGVHFTGAVFTNLTQDHLDYHVTFDRYLGAKLRLFAMIPPSGFGVVNADDPAATAFTRTLHGRPIRFGVTEPADIGAREVELRSDGSRFLLVTAQSELPVRLPIAGLFNVQNALAAAATALGAGVGLEEIAAALEDAPAPPGRFERVDRGQAFSVIVDYAHTPDGIAKLLGAVRAITSGRVLIVFGCGGDRDRGKRPQMGALAAELADRVYLTTDNPRSEDPAVIVEQIVGGIQELGKHNYVRELDRSRAIRMAMRDARAGDAVVIAGKGHEDYQLVSGDVLHFSDREEAGLALEELR
jgi:UDP-N-acetylmuramoyl-L-alanyl-D-glutamate--2,6-diaminopimelate ligase